MKILSVGLTTENPNEEIFKFTRYMQKYDRGVYSIYKR